MEKRYKVIKRVGGGAFGEIYRGKSHLIEILNFYPLVQIVKKYIVEKRKTGEHLAAKVVS